MRLAAQADLSAVAAICRDAYAVGYLPLIGSLPKPALEDYAPRIARGEVYVAERDGRPAAVLVLTAEPPVLKIYNIAVAPESQGQGLGTACLAFAEAEARRRGLTRLYLHTNTRLDANIRLYRRAGFIPSGERPHPSLAGERLMMLERALPPN
ncbi:GNAT family N-acetyltransferase [Solirhodobacter olei]|uniref:GNAT family N-acetyltransferase n=1 Tax=Solirhodobacter olei TaxID=2493082 RepID=UPI000FDC2F11|nr:GNAT family N-acetyltransferase [Solirhodobacter olei]